MSDDHITTLGDCGVTLALFEPDEKIVREAADAEACFFVIEGDVALELYVGGAESRTVQTVHSGEVIGWSWLIPPYRGAFDAVALTSVSTLRVDAALLRDAMEEDRPFGYDMMKRFCDVIVQRLGASRIRLIDMYGLAASDIGTQRLRVKSGQGVGR
ncbi:MAG: Crp/Fnr family transcriptional regulator [Actinomycetota bacterium]|nr:Crp/Fnr family transcriptional regulator [Actinomycetota bacterium]